MCGILTDCKYQVLIHCLTSGRGTFTMTFSSYELVPADVAHCIRFNSKVFAGTPQQALLKAYEEAANEEE